MHRQSLWLTLAILPLACVGEKGKTDDTGGSASDSGEVDTQDTEPQDTGCADPGEPAEGEAQDLDDSELNVILGDRSFSGTDGHWNVRSQGCISSLTSTKLLGSVNQVVTLEVYGDISGAGSYPVRSFSYSENEAQGDSLFNYVAEDPGVNFVISGYANTTYLFGSLDGGFQTVDSVSGGASDLATLVAESWPVF
jgi:hypothetical protein